MLSFAQNISLQPFNTFGIQAKAQYFAAFSDEVMLGQLLSISQNLPKMILGGGSNILLTQDYEGAVLKNEIFGKNIYRETSKEIYLEVGAGENWHGLVEYCIHQNWAGIENLSLIPGTVGAAPIQNIGAYGVEVRQVIDWVETIAITNGRKRRFTNEECMFGYRESIFKHQVKGEYIITKVGFKLQKTPSFNTSYGAIQSEIEKRGITSLSLSVISEIVCDIRRSKLPDPSKISNGGSFFKNPEIPDSQFESLKNKHPNIPHYPLDNAKTKVPAGWLIEQAGWKGKQIGQIGVHPKQALVLVNYGGGKGSEIWQLAQEIQASVLDKFGIKLTPEINII